MAMRGERKHVTTNDVTVNRKDNMNEQYVSVEERKMLHSVCIVWHLLCCVVLCCMIQVQIKLHRERIYNTNPRTALHCSKLTPLSRLSRLTSLRGLIVVMRCLIGSIERFDPGAEGRHRQSDLQIAVHSLDYHSAIRNYLSHPSFARIRSITKCNWKLRKDVYRW